MKYYVWLDAGGKLISKVWHCEDEMERMAEERRPPHEAAVLRAGTGEQLIQLYGLDEDDFAD